jgi:cytochrome b6-f complex iron-sulfur subunit
LSTIDNASSASRREFCVQAYQLAAVLTVSGMAAACGGDTGTSPSGSSAPDLTTVSGTLSGGRVSVTLSGSPLSSNGSAALVQAGSGQYLVYRSGDQAFSVLTAICTHEGCTVSGFQSSSFVCPGHGSTYSTSGSVNRGPASRALASFAWQVSDGVLSWGV